MKVLVRIVPVAFALLTLGSALAVAADDRADVKKAYKSYRQAIVEDLGQASLRFVCGTTIDYYGEIQELALYADKAELTKHPLFDQLQALSLRLLVPGKQLKQMSPTELFAHAVDNGWVLKNSVNQSVIGAITIKGDSAEAVIMMAGKVAGGNFHFCREDGAWKFNLLTVIQHSRMQFEGVARHRGLSGEEMIMRILEQFPDEKVTPKIWKPPFKKKR
jgi:hypothetical protein